MAVINNTLTAIGDAALITSVVNTSAGIIELTSYTDVTIGVTATRLFTKEYRYSVDGVIYSSYASMDSALNGALIYPTIGKVYFEFRYTRIGVDATGILTIASLDLTSVTSVSFIDKILKITSSLLPTGWSFIKPKSGVRNSIDVANAKIDNTAIVDTYAILNSILPDNDFFDTTDASNWEKSLGLVNGTGVDVSVRKEKIARKMAHPGTIKARQHYLYIQGQIQAAGFTNVYVHENRFWNGVEHETQTFQQVVGIIGQAVCATSTQCGQVQCGTTNETKIVNSMSAVVDSTFDFNGNYERTWFLGGAVIGTVASVDVNRREELRQLILTLKPVPTVVFSQINYI